MKIAHVTHSFPPYEAGTGRVCYFNALELGRLGHDVTVFAPTYEHNEFDHPNLFKLQRIATPMRLGNAPFMPGLLTQLRDFDVIHIHYPFIFGAELTWLASKLRDIPYVLTYHNDLLGDGLRGLLFKSYFPISHYLVARNASRLVTVSMSHAHHCQLTPLYEKRWQDVIEIPNGVDTDIFYPSDDGIAIRQMYQIPTDAQVITFVGSLDKAHLFKNVDGLITAFNQLVDHTTYLLIVGDGNNRAHYEAMAAESRYKDRILFVGRIPHNSLRGYYGASNVVVLPSHSVESFGMVLIEAGACGVPVVASNIPGVNSVVIDGQTGFLFERQNIDDLVEKLNMIIHDDALAHHMGEAGRKHVVQNYAWKTVVKRLEALYTEVVNE